jgi:hypothetical protein
MLTARCAIKKVKRFNFVYSYFVKKCSLAISRPRSLAVSESAKYISMDSIKMLFLILMFYCCSTFENYAQTITPDTNLAKLDLKPGRKLPDINGIDTSKMTLNLYSLQNKWIIVYIYDPACKHCESYTPQLHDFYLRNKSKGLEVYAIPVNLDFLTWKNYVKTHHYTWTNVIEAEPRLKLKTDYHVTMTPKLYLCDSQKLTKDGHLGSLPIDLLEEYLNKLINEDENRGK